ncbi:circadian clock protein KaiA [Nodosilinea sp. FACHB-131]|nr:circadian clock protein KaiA [Nodosilinea sp. FACHB-131]
MQLGLTLPVVVLIDLPNSSDDPSLETNAVPIAGTEPYPGALVHRAVDALPQLDQVIQNAIQGFLRLPNPKAASPTAANSAGGLSHSLSAQQHRLTEKLKARLGYLGVYYKRSPSSFLRHMSPDDRTAFLGQLKTDYRTIVLGYFAKDAKINLNQLIDDFVDQAFMADISVAQIVEIHMELMDHFSKQLKLEGRSEEILLDYRLTLIDVIAHLCEMYRRSIPREP